MQRIVEPELMDSPDQALAYADADFSSANELFLRLFEEKFGHPAHGSLILDIGCGPASIPIDFARAYEGSFFHAIDGSASMLDLARRYVEEAGLENRIKIYRKELPRDDLPASGYDIFICNSLLHHLHDPGALWFTINSYARRGSGICVMDLMRPEDETTARELVDRYAANEPEILREDFFNSLRAAFRVEEVEEQLEAAGLDLSVEVVSDRHMLISGNR